MTGYTAVHFNFNSGLGDRLVHISDIAMAFRTFYLPNDCMQAMGKIEAVFPAINMAKNLIGYSSKGFVQAINARFNSVNPNPWDFFARYVGIFEFYLFLWPDESPLHGIEHIV